MTITARTMTAGAIVVLLAFPAWVAADAPGFPVELYGIYAAEPTGDRPVPARDGDATETRFGWYGGTPDQTTAEFSAFEPMSESSVPEPIGIGPREYAAWPLP